MWWLDSNFCMWWLYSHFCMWWLDSQFCVWWLDSHFCMWWLDSNFCMWWLDSHCFFSYFYLQAAVGSHPVWQEAEEMSDWDGSDLENFICIFWGGGHAVTIFVCQNVLFLLQSLRNLEAAPYLRDCWECGRRNYVTARCWMRRSDCKGCLCLDCWSC